MDLLKKDYNAKITEIESKIPSISGSATTAVLTAVENKIPNVINQVKKADCNAKISDIESNYLLQLITINLQIKHLMQK